jgi:SNF2 family DNA or RNA helicase
VARGRAALRESARPRTPCPRARAELRPYQQEGLDRLALWWRHRLGGILADDMGLGKTLQVLALLLHAREQGGAAAVLVVAPTSVLLTWRDEAARFAPGCACVHDATTAKTGAAGGARCRCRGHVLRTAALDEQAFAAREWAVVVLDEAQFVKNPRRAAIAPCSGSVPTWCSPSRARRSRTR